VLLRGNRIVMPVKLSSRALELAHEGHQGIVKIKQRIRTKLWWPGVDKDCERVCRSCLDCLKVSSPEPLTPLAMAKFSEKPLDYLSADIIRHDLCYAINKDMKTRNSVCDKNMLDELKAIPNPTPAEKRHSHIAETIIRMKESLGWGLEKKVCWTDELAEELHKPVQK